MNLIMNKNQSKVCQRLEDIKLQGTDQSLTLSELAARPRRIVYKSTGLTPARRMDYHLRYNQSRHVKLIFGFQLDIDGFTSRKLYRRQSVQCRRLQRLKSLSSLLLVAQDIHRLIAIAKSLRYLTNLSTLKLHFSSIKNITSKDIQNLSLCLQQLSHLAALTLNFHRSTITEENFQQLLLCTHYLPLLISIHHSFTYCNRTPIRILDTLNPRQQAPSALSSLTLNLEGSGQTVERVMLDLNLKRFTSLLVLSLNFTAIVIIPGGGTGSFPDKCLESLAVNLLSLQSLLVFNLVFSGQVLKDKCALTNRGIESLCLSLKSVKLLNTLGLDFSASSSIPTTEFAQNINIQNITALISIPNMSQISTLTLKFRSWGNRITEENIKSLSRALKALKPLKALDLDFSQCPQIGDTALKSLSESICHHTALQSLSLSLSGCTRITNKGFRILFEHLVSLKKLKALSPNFAECMTARDIRILSDNLQHINKLESLSLDMSYCSRVTDEAIKPLGESLKHLVLLNFLSIRFDCCDKFTKKSFEILCEALRHLTLLSNLDIRALSYKKTDLTNRDLINVLDCLRCHETLHSLRLDILTILDQDENMNKLFEKLRSFPYLWSVKISFLLCRFD